MQTDTVRRTPVFLLSTVMFLALLPSFSFSAALPLIAAEWDMSSGQSGMVLGAFQAGYIVAAFVALPLTDRIDTRVVIVCGAVLTTLGHILFPLVGSDPLTGVILRAVAGAGLGGVYMPGIRLVSLVSVFRGRAVGGYVSSYLLGTAASFAVTGMLLGMVDWRTAYLCVAVAGGLACPLAVLVARMPVPDRGVVVERRSPGGRKAPRPRLRMHLPVSLMIAAYVAHMWELYGVRSWMAPFLAEVLGTPGKKAVSLAAVLTSLSVVVSGLSAPSAGWLSDRLGRIPTAGVIMVISAACSLSFGWLFTAPLWSLLLVGIIYSLTVASDSPIFSTAVTELADTRILGRVMAWQTVLGYGAATLSPVVMGCLVELSGNSLMGWGLAFSSLGVIALTGPVFLLLLRRLPESRRLCDGKG